MCVLHRMACCSSWLDHLHSNEVAWLTVSLRPLIPVPVGGQLRPSAGAGHDPADDAGALPTNGLA